MTSSIAAPPSLFMTAGIVLASHVDRAIRRIRRERRSSDQPIEWPELVPMRLNTRIETGQVGRGDEAIAGTAGRERSTR
jgi:hypothetical protein